MNLTLLKLKTGKYILCDIYEFHEYDLDSDFTNDHYTLDHFIGMKFEDCYFIENTLSKYYYAFFYGMHKNNLLFLAIRINRNISNNQLLKSFQFSERSICCFGIATHIHDLDIKKSMHQYYHFIRHENPTIQFTRLFTVVAVSHYIKCSMLQSIYDDNNQNSTYSICVYNFFDKEGKIYYQQYEHHTAYPLYILLNFEKNIIICDNALGGLRRYKNYTCHNVKYGGQCKGNIGYFLEKSTNTFMCVEHDDILESNQLSYSTKVATSSQQEYHPLLPSTSEVEVPQINHDGLEDDISPRNNESAPGLFVHNTDLEPLTVKFPFR
ncbi:hypothetical protein ECHHL_0531 [Ehrlichia chaffeensis str. Heartland]|uniref:Uncharacterized protein n=1 Tax=Ehrlichia chaffeensis (strain ATCC CRL-10679 / Arkansas) TaxID=205920 RepID=Q2GGL6_EHRCR|nr:hypothetical protein [Ehrlichia chaffeensis]ABD44744.1 hypothetical protein ECH_0607 [Ehrlichia chaffeensis str. Arkansas]AHX03688.1 hypothetical protein ECHHL_0531 [Ehrlichia chaffeensis str. Heartland]AHX07430.1 hypothetical protein ECHOSC_0539 [Ehrlichia chaffeensis str. Osceola]AHX08083.1 hypothetical protein ECHSTV_0515 [Ehrlichia chaffeensis str. Saint Vincent]AHX09226.1 hypothetical protein ECHWAK_0521 [Ehrlichia chaffeensis str. Wakulla]